MAKGTQISALISPTTRARLEQRVRATGVKKGYLLEQALLHHLQVLDELPVEMIVHPRVVVSRASFGTIAKQRKSVAPTPALLELMHDGDEGSASDGRPFFSAL